MNLKNDQQKKEPEPSPVPRTCFSMQEFSESFGVSKSAAYLWVKTGLLRTFLVGRRRFVSVDEAKQLAARLTEQGK
jgi:predicted site-specific integrase-resolvase